LFLLFFLFTSSPAFAQSWAGKAAKSLLTVKTFAADGSLIGSSNGFFVGTDGEAISSFQPFRGAVRAVVIDTQGKEIAVKELLGVNDMYDVIKFRVDAKKTLPLAIATSTAAQGSNVWLMPYGVKKTPTCQQGTISNVETFQNEYPYYTLQLQAEESQVSCPVLNQNGEVIGLLQLSANSKTQGTEACAISAKFAADLKVNALSLNEQALKSVAIAKAIPDKQDEALLSLFLSSSAMNATEHADYVTRFIQKYPDVADGYYYRARIRTADGDFTNADADMQQAIKVADKPDDAHYQYALLIYQKNILQSDKPYEAWTLDKAFSEAQEAYRLSPMPTYLQLQAEIRRAQGNNDEQIALLDSALNQFTKPYADAAAPCLLSRAQALYAAGKYRPAVNDFNDYAKLMPAQLNDGFYYQREQAEFKGHLYQQALEDIDRAIRLAPNEPLYLAEKASVQVRVGLYQAAHDTAQQLITLAPDLSDGYLFLGLTQCLTDQKAEGVKNLNKAKELGNEQAQALIEKYGQ